MDEEVKEVIEETKEEVTKEVEEESKDSKKKSKKEKPQKAKKEKKPKKEKKKKESDGEEKPKKKGGKKLIILLVLLIILAAIGFTAYKMIPVIMGDKGEAYTVSIRMDYKKNLLYNKYPVNVSFNNTSIGSLKQGEELEYATSLHNGSYVITFTDANDSENTISGIVQVEGDTNYQYKLKADWKGITFSDSVNPIGFKPIEGATPAATEETKEEAPEAEATESVAEEAEAAND